MVISKPIEPEEFIEEARGMQEAIRTSKVRKEDPLKVKEIWGIKAMTAVDSNIRIYYFRSYHKRA